jgi:hypothetical protein
MPKGGPQFTFLPDVGESVSCSRFFVAEIRDRQPRYPEFTFFPEFFSPCTEGYMRRFLYHSGNRHDQSGYDGRMFRYLKNPYASRKVVLLGLSLRRCMYLILLLLVIVLIGLMLIFNYKHELPDVTRLFTKRSTR